MAGEASGSPQHPRVTTITIPWTGPVSAAVKGIIHVPAHSTPMKPSRRDENHRPGTKRLKIADQRPGHTGLTRRNVGGSPTPGTHDAETALAGWGARIRTSEWRIAHPHWNAGACSVVGALMAAAVQVAAGHARNFATDCPLHGASI